MSTIKTDTLQNVAGTKSVPVNAVVDGSAKAWVNFNGTGTVAIRASFNVSSITDNGTGDYTVNSTNAMPDANYAHCVDGRIDTGASDLNFMCCAPHRSAQTTTAFRFLSVYRSAVTTVATTHDGDQMTAAFFR